MLLGVLHLASKLIKPSSEALEWLTASIQRLNDQGECGHDKTRLFRRPDPRSIAFGRERNSLSSRGHCTELSLLIRTGEAATVGIAPKGEFTIIVSLSLLAENITAEAKKPYLFQHCTQERLTYIESIVSGYYKSHSDPSKYCFRSHTWLCRWSPTA